MARPTRGQHSSKRPACASVQPATVSAHAEASQLAAYLRISASEIDDVIDRLERLRKTPGDEEPVGMHPFDRDRLATVHAIAEHPPRLFGDLKRRFRSTELPRLPREAGERDGHRRWTPQLLRQRAALVQAAACVFLAHAEAPRAARQDDAAGAEPRIFGLFVGKRAAELAHLAPVPQALHGITGARPLGGAAVPAHRLGEIGGLFPVMRQER